MLRAPLLLPAAAFALGAALELQGLGAAALTLAAAAFAVLRRFDARLRAGALVSGIAVSLLHGHPPAVLHPAATARYAAVVLDAGAADDGRTAALLRIERVGVVRANLGAPVTAGQRVVVRGRLEPLDEPRNPGEPSPREIGQAQGIAGRLGAAAVLATAGPDDGRDPRIWAARLRAAAAGRVRAVIPEPYATILAGALWGERGTLPDDLRDAFQATGTVHVLVTAGLHLGVVAALLTMLLAVLGLPRALTCALAMAGIIAYAWFSGAHVPAQRAAAMLVVALLARACGARALSWNALAIAAIVVTLLWPASVTSASFALSFSCVAAILLFATPLSERFAALRLPAPVAQALALTVATQLGTWPLTAAVFATLAPYAVLANAIVVPLTAFALVGGLATLALPACAPLETLLLVAIERIVRTIAALPAAHLTIAAPPPLTIAAYDAAAVAAATHLRAGTIRRAALLLLGGAALVLLPPAIAAPRGLTIVHLDVGQADAAVIRTPRGRTILIDAGGELERGAGEISTAERAGARIVLGYLRRAGIRRIDLMILTHPHGDHVGAARPILDAMPVGMIFDSGQNYAGRAYRDAMVAAHIHCVPVVLARRGMRWESGDGVTLEVLAPSLPLLSDTGDDVNENSIVAMLSANGFRELFMGDAGKDSEARLLANGEDVHADIVKVGHHGSRYASTPAFVASVHPHVAVISVGRHNTFGHPALATIESWSNASADVLRTDQCGAISLVNGSPTPMLPCAAPRP